jgi:hypothetical protein
MSISEEKQLKKPLSLTLVAIGYVAVMVLHSAQIYAQGRALYPHDFLLLALYPVAAYGIFKVRWWAWSLVVAHIIFLIASNVILAVADNHYDDALLIQLNLLLLFFLWFFLRKSVRSPFHNPALRWWERQHPRFGANFGVTLRTANGDAIRGDGINLSRGGCFVKLEPGQSLALKDRVEVSLRYEDFDSFQGKGQVTWVTEGSELNPKGVGIAFSRPDRVNRLVLRAMLKLVEARWRKSEQAAPA